MVDFQISGSNLIFLVIMFYQLFVVVNISVYISVCYLCTLAVSELIIIIYTTGWTKKNATLGIGWGYYSKKYATTLILIR